MTRDEIIRMALEAGFLKHADALYTNHRFGDCIGELERFAALVAAAEREACAKVCEARANEEIGMAYEGIALDCEAAIRARGNT